jgi:hypothetical protein
MSECLARALSSRSQISRWSLNLSPRLTAILGPVGQYDFRIGLALRGDEIMAVDQGSCEPAMLTSDPARGGQGEPG